MRLDAFAWAYGFALYRIRRGVLQSGPADRYRRRRRSRLALPQARDRFGASDPEYSSRPRLRAYGASPGLRGELAEPPEHPHGPVAEGSCDGGAGRRPARAGSAFSPRSPAAAAD